MSEVEPAWRAELRETASRCLGVYTQDEVLAVILPHIQAAEQRGREEGLRQGRCQRCKGSGIDPEHSYPAEGPSYHSMGEPPHLEPCIDCQFPESP